MEENTAWVMQNGSWCKHYLDLALKYAFGKTYLHVGRFDLRIQTQLNGGITQENWEAVFLLPRSASRGLPSKDCSRSRQLGPSSPNFRSPGVLYSEAFVVCFAWGWFKRFLWPMCKFHVKTGVNIENWKVKVGNYWEKWSAVKMKREICCRWYTPGW